MQSRPFGDNLVLAVRKYLNDNSLKSLGQINAEVLADIAERYYSHFQELHKKKRATKPGWSQEEIAIYEAYPRKVAPEDAVRAIRNAMQGTTGETLLESTRRYGAAVLRWPASYRYKEGRDLVPHPATWFNRGSYRDDPKEWVPAGMFTRPDDPQGGVGRVLQESHHSSLGEPALGWRERVKESEDLAIFAGRSWDTINDYYKKQIIRLSA